MRDIILALVIIALLVKTLRQVEFGAYLWAWLSLMNPHRMAYGFANSIPWAQSAALVSLVSLLISKDRRPIPINGGVVALLLLWLWMTVTSLVSINPPEMVWDRWIFVSKIFLMLMVTLMVIRGRVKIERLIWVVVVSIGYFGFKGGIFTLMTGGSYKVWGPTGSMVEENNALAVALIVILPLIYYLRHAATRQWLKQFLLLALVLVGVSILGSQSRGALVGLLAMAFVLGSKSKNPVRFSLVLILLIGAGIAFMPDTWTSRMDTIQTYGEDTSAMSRIYTWQTLWNAAVDRPLVGAGFRADTLAFFERYAPIDSKYEAVTGNAWVAHSIYFQALGEHGFVGLGLYLYIWLWVWFAAARLAKQAEKIPEYQDWMPTLLRMCQVSTVGFCAGGAFLSLMTFDLPFYILALVSFCQCEIKDRALRIAAAAVPPLNAGIAVAGPPGPVAVAA